MPRSFKKRQLIFFLIAISVAVIFWREYYQHQPPENWLLQNVILAVVDTGLNNNVVPAIDDPVFESVANADSYLENDGFGIVFNEGQTAVFYPFQILVWHNIINDISGKVPILISYNPLCDSAAVFERMTPDGVLLFENSGQVLNNSLLITDKDKRSLWDPLSGQVISGEATGQSLHRLESATMLWSDFKKNFPDGQVLSRETGVERDYSYNPYSHYATSPDVFFPLEKYDTKFPIKTKVFAYGEAVCPEDDIKSQKIIDDQGIRFVWDEDWQAVRGYQINDDGSNGEEIGLYSGYWMCWMSQVNL